MPASIQHRDLWPTVGHPVQIIATRGGGCTGSIFPTTILVYRSAIYPQGMTSECGLGGRLQRTLPMLGGRECHNQQGIFCKLVVPAVW